MKWLLMGVFMLLAGCETLRDDNSVPAVRSNYPTAEFSACGKVFHGLGACPIYPGQNPNSIGFYIQGYYSGSIRVFSAECGLDRTVTYSNSERVVFDLPNNIDKSCLIDFSVSPEYPQQDKNAVVVYGLSGQLFLKVVLPGEDWVWVSNRFPKNSFEYVTVPMVGSEARVVMYSKLCETNFDKVLPIVRGQIELSTDDIRLYEDKCVLNGVMINDRKRYFTWMSYRHAKEFVPLGIPKIELNGDKLSVVGDSAVAVVSLNEKYELGNTASFKFNRLRTNILRLLTVKGRSVIGIWENGVWTWLQ